IGARRAVSPLISATFLSLVNIAILPPPAASLKRRSTLSIAYESTIISSGNRFSPRTHSIICKGRIHMAIAVGQAAPDFSLKDQYDKEVKLSDYKGKKRVVLVFYPLDWSPTCTQEHVCLVNDMKKFEQLDAQVMGLSVDSVWSHKAWAEKMGIRYPLLADFHPRGAVASKFGVYMEDRGITGRAIVIINKAGNLAWFKQYDIPTVPDLDEVAQALAQVK